MGMLDGKVIALAGVGGIGDELARRYALEGAQLVFGDINDEDIATLQKEIDPTADRAVGVHLDGSDESSIKAFVDLALTKFGRLDGFHANFAEVLDGIRPEGLELPMEIVDDMLRINLRGYFLCSRLAVPAMIETGGGSMLYTSSAEGFMGSDVRFAYAMCKGGIQSLMRNVAVRYGPQGIRANCVAPGLILHRKIPPEDSSWSQGQISRTAIKTRGGRPPDIASISALLLSDQSGYISGQVISVDGGMTMRP